MGMDLGRWVFTCSYGGATKVTCRLNRTSAMEPLSKDQYVQVLVVRRDDDLEGYLRHCGRAAGNDGGMIRDRG